MKFLRVNKRNLCPICGKAQWCGVSADGAIAICMRLRSDRQADNGGWVHRLIESDAPAPRPAKAIEAPAKKSERSVFQISEIYTAFLNRLVLAHEHRDLLEARGLGEADIHLHGYRSMPTAAYASSICRQLVREGHNLAGVPGFYRRGNDWHFIDYRNASGFLIPIRNRKAQIVGLQLRRDDDQKPKYMMMSSAWHADGASSGAPPHFATLGVVGRREEVWRAIVTEGPLKANIIAEYTYTPTVGLVGVGCFDDAFPELLKEAFPNLENCLIAFDLDAATNPAVKSQRMRLQLTLEKLNLRSEVLSWNRHYKGFDDYLVNKSRAKKLAA